MRVTRAALRAGKVHEDEDVTPPIEEQSTFSETPKPVLKDITNQAASTPVGTAMRTPKFELAVQQTPKFDPNVHKEVETPKDLVRDAETAKDDSFVEHIITRTPKPLRIEDSVEAMDALEDAIEQISEELPVIPTIDAEFPVKHRKSISTTPKSESPGKEAPATRVARTPRAISPKKSPLKAVMPSTTASIRKAVAPTPKRPSPVVTKPANKPPAARVSTVQPVKRPSPIVKAAVKPASRPSTIPPVKRPSPIVKNAPKQAVSKPVGPTARRELSSSKSLPSPTPNTMQKRKTSGALSTSKPAFVPTKSTKAPTTSKFVLPGEAIAAKLKVQREERHKREEAEMEAEEKKKRTFKARPAPPAAQKFATLPRENKTSRARLSMMATTNTANKSTAPDAKPASTLSVNKTRTAPIKANSGVRRTTTNTFGPSISKMASPKVDAEELKVRAKKAREEAAEKGRIASREWAERQKKRLALEAAKSKSNEPKTIEVAVV